MEKKCNTCGQVKDEYEFFFRDKEKGVRRGQCKDCYKSKRNHKDYYENNKEQYLERTKKRKKKILEENRKNLLTFFAGKSCADCEETDFVVFEFDHINPEEKEFSIASMIRNYKWDRVLKEIQKCEIVCANCHKRRTAKQFNWWKS